MQNVSINQRVKISHNCLFGHIRSKTGEKQDTDEIGRTKRMGAPTTGGREVDVLEDEKQRK